MRSMPQNPKKGDRQRTPRSPFGLPSKRPRQDPPRPPTRLKTVAMNVVDSCAVRAKMGAWAMLESLAPVVLLLAVLLQTLRGK
jgi:hypothetical protein